ncbi:MAG: substrate-binding domain-containing protein [Oscillospiraceae bacterium]
MRLKYRLKEEGFSGVAISPVNHPSVAAKISELTSCGIPVVTVNTDINNSNRLAYVGSDYYKCGKTAGNLMELITGGQANVGIVTGSDSVLCHSERIAGFKRYIQKKQCDIRIAGIVENHDDDFESFAVTKKLLEEHPEIDALYLVAAGVYGAGRAVQSLGLAGRLKIICFDVVPTTKKLIKDGTLAAAIDQQPFKQGSLPLEILSDYLGMGITPVQDAYYTSINIRIRENC